MEVNLLQITPEAERLIESAARECYQSLHKVGTNPKFILNLIKNNHLSVLEQAHASFRIVGVSRVLTHQLVRHRHLGFAQVSQRHVDHGGFKYVTPPGIEENERVHIAYTKLMHQCNDFYKISREEGVSRQETRYGLPNSTETIIRATGNLRVWFEFLPKRLSSAAEWEIRHMAGLIYKKLHEKCPQVFNEVTLPH